MRRRPAPSRRNRPSPSSLGPHGQVQSEGRLHHRLGDRSSVLAHDLATRSTETPLRGHSASLAPARRISGSVTAAPTPEVTVRRRQDLRVPNLEENRGESAPRSGELRERICIRCREERSDTAAAGSARSPHRRVGILPLNGAGSRDSRRVLPTRFCMPERSTNNLEAKLKISLRFRGSRSARSRSVISRQRITHRQVRRFWGVTSWPGSRDVLPQFRSIPCRPARHQTSCQWPTVRNLSGSTWQAPSTQGFAGLPPSGDPVPRQSSGKQVANKGIQSAVSARQSMPTSAACRQFPVPQEGGPRSAQAEASLAMARSRTHGECPRLLGQGGGTREEPAKERNARRTDRTAKVPQAR